MNKSLRLLVVSAALTGSGGLFAADYYVSASGNDSNSGTLASPYQTIQKAANVAVAGDTVFIRAGTYRETVTPSQSGTAGNPITFTAYNGEAVTVSGLDLVTGAWTQHGGEIYKKTVTMSLGAENQVFVNGESQWEARWPNITSYDLDGLLAGMAKVDSSSAANIVQDNSLFGADGNFTGASIYIRSGEFSNGNGAWFAQSGSVTAYDGTAKRLTVTLSVGGFGRIVAKNNWYYLFGKLNLLDAEHEWFYDSASSTL